MGRSLRPSGGADDRGGGRARRRGGAAGPRLTFDSEASGGISLPFDIAPAPGGAGSGYWVTAAANDVTANDISDQSSPSELWFVTPQGKILTYSKGLLANDESSPIHVAPGPDGMEWFTDLASGSPMGVEPAQIGRVDAAGSIVETPLPARDAPWDIVAGPGGSMWFTDRRRAIGMVDAAGTVKEWTAGLGSHASPSGLVVGPDGNLWFTDAAPSAPAIGVITPAGRIKEFPLHLGKGELPIEIASGPDGNLWFTVGHGFDGNDVPKFPIGSGRFGAIGRITPRGKVTLFAHDLPVSANPWGIAAGPDGALWFTDANTLAPAVGRITPGGAVTEFTDGLGPVADTLPTGSRAVPTMTCGSRTKATPGGKTSRPASRSIVSMTLPGLTR